MKFPHLCLALVFLCLASTLSAAEPRQSLGKALELEPAEEGVPFYPGGDLDPEAREDAAEAPGAPLAAAVIGETRYLLVRQDGGEIALLARGVEADGDWRQEPTPLGTVEDALLVVRRDEIELRDGLWVFPAEPGATVWRYLPPAGLEAGEWKESGQIPSVVTPSSGVGVGPAHVFVTAQSPEGGGLFSYHLFTQKWTDLSDLLPLGEEVLIGTRESGELLVSVDGEVFRAELVYTQKHFGWLDYLVIAGYIGVLMWIGSYFARRDKNTDDFFLGGRKIPWWAAGLSIYATGVSAISFMAIPAKTYATDWLRISEPIVGFFAAVIVAYAFVPLLRRLQITTIMEYQEMRFNKVIRTVTSALVIFGQVGGRMSVVLLLPSIALSAVAGIPVWAAIVIMGVLATIYTVAGGIGAVIWTDVIQFFVLMGGALLSLGIIVAQIEGGLFSALDLAWSEEKFRAFDPSFNFIGFTVWVFLLWGIGDLFGGRLGQEGMQRAFATASVKEARRSMLFFAVVSIPGTILFFGMGAALFAFYYNFPEQLNPNLQTDAIFPLFIAQELPAGLSGLVIAGLFAAAMSTLDSGMNVVSTVSTKDFYAVYRKDASETERLWAARVITAIAGAFATGFALWLSQYTTGSLWDRFSEIMGLIGGGFGGVMALGLLTKRANWLGVVIAGVVSTWFLWWVKFNTPIVFLIYGILAMSLQFGLGYALSLLFDVLLPEDIRRKWGLKRDLTGLTLWTVSKESANEA